MRRQSSGSLSHFSVYGLTPDYWRLADSERAELRADWVAGLRTVADAVHHYRTAPTRVDSDILVWCGVGEADGAATRRFFDAHTKAVRPFRRFLEARHVLWGFTRPSPYGRSRSKGAIDPFKKERAGFLVVYPFSKTPDWYMTPQEERQRMMSDHIRIGRSHDGITQLLLYSTGLQDHEFVVVYETEDLPRFSQLVRELRETEARVYTSLDAPVHVAIHAPSTSLEDLWP